jgi:hypothetical protein
MMRALVFALLLFLPAAAAAQETPRALLESAFAPYQTGNFPTEWDWNYSERLKALFAADRSRYADDEVPTVNFDPLIDAQDIEVTDVVIAEPVVQGDTAVGVVTFLNYGEPGITVVAMVKEGDVWRIDDIAIMRGEYRYLLSELLRRGPEHPN